MLRLKARMRWVRYGDGGEDGVQIRWSRSMRGGEGVEEEVAVHLAVVVGAAGAPAYGDFLFFPILLAC